jgi:chemotaxis protein MotB
LVIEGHTDAVPYTGRQFYSNWELSADRANAARRAMEASGLRSRQVVEVRGYADSKLLDPKHPKAAINRRVSIRVNLVDPASSGTPKGAGGAKDAQPPFPLNIQPETTVGASTPPADH